MLTRHLDEDDDAMLPPRRTAEREMTLGPGAILGIFFGLVLLLGAFFGFGYKLGSSSAKTAGQASSADASGPAAQTSSTNFGAFKPAAGSPAGSAPNIVVHDGSPVLTTPVSGSAPRSPQTSESAALTPAEPAPPSAPLTLSRTAPTPPAPTPAAPLPAAVPNGSFVVQVAAVSHQEDAELLINALHARGYSVAARSEPGDKLVHIQVGPFGSKKDAEAMKARLSADGYNAYIK